MALQVHCVDGAGACRTPSLQSIAEFCADNVISRSLFYNLVKEGRNLVKEGRGPRLTKVSRRTLISSEAAAEWRARMQRETEEAAARPKTFKYRGGQIGQGRFSRIRGPQYSARTELPVSL
jgi:hypothetical protein